jgi:sugar O-acyltransferase (sialic acid O-acetyltransferase NeuD family)
MSKPDIFVFGASDHARVTIDAIELEGRYRIVGLFDSFKPRGTFVAGYRVLGNEDDLLRHASATGLTRGIVGIGHNGIRQQIAQRIERAIPEVEWIKAVHPSATLARSAELEGGVLVMPRCYIGLNTLVRRGAVVATKSIFEHDGVMGAYATLGAGSTTGGRVTLGEGAAVCLGVTIIHGMTVGKHAVVGAGATVINDIAPYCVAYGTPARVVRKREPDGSYLHIRSESYEQSCA